jgi:hypothetical protein
MSELNRLRQKRNVIMSKKNITNELDALIQNLEKFPYGAYLDEISNILISPIHPRTLLRR